MSISCLLNAFFNKTNGIVLHMTKFFYSLADLKFHATVPLGIILPFVNTAGRDCNTFNNTIPNK